MELPSDNATMMLRINYLKKTLRKIPMIWQRCAIIAAIAYQHALQLHTVCVNSIIRKCNSTKSPILFFCSLHDHIDAVISQAKFDLVSLSKALRMPAEDLKGYVFQTTVTGLYQLFNKNRL